MNATVVFAVVWVWLMIIVTQLVLPLVGFDPQLRLYYSNVAMLLTSLVAGLICLWSVRGLPAASPIRRGWLMIGAGVVAWGLGQGVFAYYPLVNGGEDPPYPYYSDIGFLATSPLVALALLGFYRSMGLQAPLWGRVVAVLLALGFGYWAVQANLEGIQSGEIWLLLTSLGYGLMDPLLIGVTVFVASSFRLGSGLGRSWWLVAAGSLIYAIGNQIWSYLVLIEVYQTGHPIDISWPLAFGLMAWASVETRQSLRSA